MVALIVLHAVISNRLIAAGITFPASIVGMLGGFLALCAVQVCSPATAARMVSFFEPACQLFRDWLAAIFAPGFVALPLTMPHVALAELGSFAGLLLVGLISTTATNAIIAAALSPRPVGDGQGGVPTRPAPVAQPPKPQASRPRSPFPPALRNALNAIALVGGGLYLLLGHSPAVLTVCLMATTLGSFASLSVLCPWRIQLWIHPFLSCTAATHLVCAILGTLSGEGMRPILTAYAAPQGAGSILLSLMGPTVVSFALQLFQYRARLRERLVQILGTAVLGSFCTMVSTAAAARLCGLPTVLRLALLSRCTISAVAADISRLLGVNPPALGLLGAFISGLLAIALGKPILDKLGVRDPAARGLALAGAGHGGGLLALADEPDAFPFAALMLNLSAAAAVCLLSIPSIRALLLATAGA
jgi:putative effector of murein hydrolase